MFPGRFVLGIGVSHGPMMTRVGINYAKPLTFMRDYLARMSSAPYGAARPSSEAPVVVAALLPKMLQLAAAETDGTIPTFVTPERTAQIRAEIGPDKLICVQQISMLERDASKARTAIRGLIAFYLGLPNYLQSLKLMGFNESDFADGGSDRIVDAMVAWGDEQAIRDRITAQYKAGATHVCITRGQIGRERRGMESCNRRQPRARDARRADARGARTAMNWLLPIVIGVAI